jgi:hypothetical protein
MRLQATVAAQDAAVLLSALAPESSSGCSLHVLHRWQAYKSVFEALIDSHIKQKIC